MSKISEYLAQQADMHERWTTYQDRLVAITIPPLLREDGEILIRVTEDGILSCAQTRWRLSEVPKLIAYLREISEDQPPRAFCNCQANTTSLTSNG